MGKHFDWSLFSLWSELLSAMTDINSIWTSAQEWEEGEKSPQKWKRRLTVEMSSVAAHSRPFPCVLYLHLPFGPNVPLSHKASYKNTVLPCPRAFCVLCFGNTESHTKSWLLIQGKANTIGINMFHLHPLSWSLLWGFGPQQKGWTCQDVTFSVSMSFRQLYTAVLRLGK